MNAKEQNEWLLMRVNLALHFAPDVPTPDYSNVVEDFVRIVKGKGHSLKRWQGIKAKDWDNNLSEYERLLKEIIHFEDGQKNNPVKKFLSKEIGYLTFNVPTGCKFTVLNTKSHLEWFKKKIGKNVKTFVNPKRYTLPSVNAIIDRFLIDGELENAVQAAELHNVKLGYGVNNKQEVIVFSHVEPVEMV